MHVYKSWPSHFDVAESLVTNHTTNLEPLDDTTVSLNIPWHCRKATWVSQRARFAGGAEVNLGKNWNRKTLLHAAPKMMAHLLISRQSKCLRGDNARCGISGEQRRNDHVTRRSLVVQPRPFCPTYKTV